MDAPRNRRRKSGTAEIALQVTDTFIIPAWYETATPAQREEALRIGASLYDTVSTAATTQAVTDIEQRKTQEVAKIRADAEARTEALAKELAAAEQQHAQRHTELVELQRAKEAQARRETEEFVKAQYEGKQLAAAQELDATRKAKTQMEQMLEMQKKEAVEQTKRQAEERIRALQSDILTHEERIKALNAGKATLEADRDRDIRIAEERTRALLQQVIDEKERAILRADKTIAGLQETIQGLSNETRELGDMIRKKSNANVKTKGNDYEEIFRAKLVAAYSIDDRFSIEDSSKNGVGHAGDSITRHGSNRILWEVKNYDKPVGNGEVEKFKRDMKENADVSIGVMVSRYTPIVGKVSRGNWENEFIGGKMHIYLSEFENMSENTLSVLMLLFQQFWAADRSVEVGESLSNAVRAIESLRQEAKKRKTELRLHKSRMEDTMRWMVGLVEEIDSKVENALNILQNDNMTVVDVPPGIFRECEGDEKALQTIQCILDFTEPREGDACVMNDLADLVGKRKGFSRDTAKSHIRSVLLDSAFDQPKGKAGRVIGLVLKGDTIEYA